MADRVGQQLGNYQLVRLLGEGGFAEVYLGEHIHLGTQAAIKVLYTQLTSDDVDKFRTEARTIARLIHPNIVRVLEFGVEDKTPFLVMDYASNGTLRQRHPKGVPLPLATVIAYVKQVADALQFAHDEKLIHRDIKPENMLLGRRNEILLSDFGIALVAQSSRYQNTQDMAGTVAYMAPEQIQAHPRPASDQYSLGIVVYEWLSGDRPFHGSFTEIAIKHTVVPPPPLSEKIPAIPPSVEQVVMIALAKGPHQRFGSVQAFANALEQASQADAATIVKLSAPTVQPLPATVIIPSKPENKPPVLATPPLEPTLPVVILPPKPEDKPPVLVTPPLEPTLPVVFSRPVGTVICTCRGHSEKVSAVAWSPDGKRIVSGSDDTTVQLWDVITGRNVFSYRGHSEPVRAVAWSPSGLGIVSASRDKTAQVWDAFAGQKIVTYRGHSNSVNTIAWSPDGQSIASGSDDKEMHLWDAGRGNYIVIYRGFSYAVATLAWSPDGLHLISGGNNEAQVWNATAGRRTFTHRGHSDRVNAVACSPDGKHIASGSDDKTVQIWNVGSRNSVFTYQGHSDRVNTVAWSPDGRHVATGSSDGTIRVWSATTRDDIYIHRGHSGTIFAVAWSPDGTSIASASEDKTVQVWVAP